MPDPLWQAQCPLCDWSSSTDILWQDSALGPLVLGRHELEASSGYDELRTLPMCVLMRIPNFLPVLTHVWCMSYSRGLCGFIPTFSLSFCIFLTSDPKLPCLLTWL